jgi:hypothetical protein
MLPRVLKSYAKRSPMLRRWARWYLARTKHHDWARLIARDAGLWGEARRRARGGTRVLLATSTGGDVGSVNLEGALAAALTLRGADVRFLLCDGALPACMLCTIGDHGQSAALASEPLARSLCGACARPAERALRPLELPIERYGAHLTPEDREAARRIAASVPRDEIPRYRHDGLAVGEHAYAGALRFLGRGDLGEEAAADGVLRQYLCASLLTRYAMGRLLDAVGLDAAVFNHGIYVPQGIVGEACRQKNVHVVNWNPAYKKRCFIFSHGDTYHHTMMTEPHDVWRALPWDDARERELMDYLESRWSGENDWIWFHEKQGVSLESLAARTGLDFAKPMVGLLTSVMWDAALHYPSNVFPSMLAWVRRTIEYFAGRPDVQLVIRVHPAEVRGTLPARQRIADEIRKAFPRCPPNVFVVPPEWNVSTYALMHRCNAVIIYNTKTGAELAAKGVPVIVAGEAWIRNKGFAFDVESERQYIELLDRLPLEKDMSAENVQNARKYAYHFFFRRMIPLEFMEPTGGTPPFQPKLDSLAELLPGASAGLDTICRGIMTGDPFVHAPDA